MAFDFESLKKELESNKVQFLDVREENEWNEGHLDSAVLVPLSKIREGELPVGLDMQKKTYLH